MKAIVDDVRGGCLLARCLCKPCAHVHRVTLVTFLSGVFGYFSPAVHKQMKNFISTENPFDSRSCSAICDSMNSSFISASFVLSVFALGCSTISAQYVAYDIGPVGAFSATARDINENGVIVGNS